MKSIASVLVFFFFGISAIAQESIDILSLSGQYGLPQEYNPQLSEKAQETVGLLNLRIPVVFSDKTIWYSDFSYTYSKVSNGLSLSGDIMNPIELHGLVLQTGLVQRIDETRAFQLLFVPRFMSDFKNPGRNAWQFGGVVLYEKKYSENLRLRFGAMYNGELAGPLLVPLVDVDWKFAPKWSITGLLPIYGKVNYKINDRTTTGISLFGLVTSYALSDEHYANDYMERTSVDITAFAKWKVMKNVFLEGRIGYALARDYTQYHKDESLDLKISIIKVGDNRGEPINPVFNDGPIINARLVYSLPIN